MRFILITILVLMVLPVSVFASILDLECKLKRHGAQYNKFLIDSKHDKTSDAAKLLQPTKEKKWWQFWIESYDDTQYLSIDIDNNKTLSSPDPVMINVSPNEIIFHEYVNCSGLNAASCKDWIFQYNINRITGEINGLRRAPDDSWAPYFKHGDIMYSFSGYCELIKRKF